MRRRKHAVNTLVPVFVDGVPRRLEEGTTFTCRCAIGQWRTCARAGAAWK